MNAGKVIVLLKATRNQGELLQNLQSKELIWMESDNFYPLGHLSTSDLWAFNANVDVLYPFSYMLAFGTYLYYCQGWGMWANSSDFWQPTL